MDFSKNLRYLMDENSLNQTEMAKAINVSQRTISGWLSGQNEPSISAIIDISKFFGVNSDYILGLSDEEKVVFQNSFDLTEAEKKHLTNLRRLKPQTQQYIFGLVENLALSS